MFHPAHRTVSGALAILAIAGTTLASSHSDAPSIKLDPQANLTDVYAFIGTKFNDPNTQVLNVIVNVRPFSEPGDGPHYERFSADARYSIHITDPTTASERLRFDFSFTPTTENYKNLGTILSYGLGTELGGIVNVGGPRQNFTQFYSVSTSASMPATTGMMLVAPPNVGGNTTPAYNDADGKAITGATTFKTLDSYTQQTVFENGDGVCFFAGPRDDSFFADVPGVFDLLNVRILDNNGSLSDGLGQDGNGVDGFKGFNVLTYAVQIPLDALEASGYQDPFFGEQTGVGVYASVSRPEIRSIDPITGEQSFSGDFVQVNRLANPLFNEVLVALADKDRYNATDPAADAQFDSYALNPEIATLVNTVYGTSFVATDRTDLKAVFIPDVIRVSTTSGPVPLTGEPGFSRFGFIGGDMTGGVSSGWPNGRRLGDDVVDIALTAVASGPSYETITLVGDNVEGNDVAYHSVFPYAATPHSGTNNTKDSQPGPTLSGDVNGDGVVDLDDLNLVLTNFGAGSGR